MVVFMDFIMGNVMDKMALPLPFYDGQVALDLVESPASFFQPLSLLSATVQERAVARVVLSSLRVVTLAGRVVREGRYGHSVCQCSPWQPPRSHRWRLVTEVTWPRIVRNVTTCQMSRALVSYDTSPPMPSPQQPM